MAAELEADANESRMFEELQELVALEVKDILAMAEQEGFSPRDTVSALELALRAEIEALAENRLTDEGAISPDTAVR